MILLKLRSRTDASLIVTLFLLIVCSTVGSIILTAATANVGRISERAEYDRKYYKVISAARLFADEIAGKEITLTLTRSFPDEEAGVGAEIDIARPPSLSDIPDAGDKLSVILQNDLYDIYTGGKDKDSITIAETAERYWNYNFSNIGSAGDYSVSRRTTFTMATANQEGETIKRSTVYGRFGVEALRTGVIDADLAPGLENVTHNVTAVFYSDENPENQNQIPENAYVVKLVCPADAVYPTFSADEHGETMSITFKWTRDNMRIEQVRGVI